MPRRHKKPGDFITRGGLPADPAAGSRRLTRRSGVPPRPIALWRDRLLPATIPAMPFTGDPADAIAREEARVARLEKELEESRTALESLRTVLAAGLLLPQTAPVVIPSPTAPVTSSEKVALFRSLRSEEHTSELQS